MLYALLGPSVSLNPKAPSITLVEEHYGVDALLSKISNF